MQPGLCSCETLTVKVTEDLAHLAVRHIAQFRQSSPSALAALSISVWVSPACPSCGERHGRMPSLKQQYEACMPIILMVYSPYSSRLLSMFAQSSVIWVQSYRNWGPFRQPADLCNSCYATSQHTARRDDTVCLFQTGSTDPAYQGRYGHNNFQEGRHSIYQNCLQPPSTMKAHNHRKQ